MEDKKIKIAEAKRKWYETFRLIAIILVCMVLVWSLFSGIIINVWQAAMTVVVPFLIALFISYLFEPLVNFLNEKCKFKRGIAVGVIVSLILIVLAVLFFVLTKFLLTQILNFVENDWPKIVEWFNAFIAEHDLQSIYDTIKKYIDIDGIKPIIVDFLSFGKSIYASVSGALINGFLTIIFLIYLLYDKTNIFKGAIKIFPKKVQKHLNIVGPKSNDIIHAYFRGKFISMIFLAIYFSIAFQIIDLGGYGILFAILLALLDIIPIVGPLVGTVIPMIFTFIFKDNYYLHIYTPIAVLGIDLIGQLIQEKVITPLIIGKQMKINSLLLLVSMLFFGSLLGLAGVILAIPICGVLKVTFEYLNITFFKKEEEEVIQIE